MMLQSMKEKASNTVASAKAGMAKTKAVVQEKVKRVTANNPSEKEMATEKKQEKIKQAEYNKQQSYKHHHHHHHGAAQGHK